MLSILDFFTTAVSDRSVLYEYSNETTAEKASLKRLSAVESVQLVRQGINRSTALALPDEQPLLRTITGLA